MEVLDPELNHALPIITSMSNTIFRKSCSSAPPTCCTPFRSRLQDRMEILRLPGYTENEKMEIAKRFLVKRQREATGITDKNLSFTDEGLLHIIRHYTQESGVRNLEREIQNISARWRAKSSRRKIRQS